jgi:putative OPT family oligopeptide transporter
MKPRELTIRGLILGALITTVFTAANIYLGLKVGLTFASSIPAAVISMAILSVVKDSSILENNIVQTVASAAGTLSAIIFVLPGLVIVGWWTEFPFWQSFLICLSGGVLGVVFTIPLRRALVTNSDLPYPEGVAAAEVLKVGSGTRGETKDETGEAREGLVAVIFGSVASAGLAIITATRIAAGQVGGFFRVGALASTGYDIAWSLALLGAGHLVGLSVGMAILTGLVIAWAIAVPILTSMQPDAGGLGLAAHTLAIWRTQVRFIGAGAIAVAAIYTLAKLAKPVVGGLVSTLAASKSKVTGDDTDRDISPPWILALTAGCLIISAWLAFTFARSTVLASSAMKLTLIAVPFVLVAGFLIAGICGYIAGLIDASNSPISGVGILSIVLCASTLILAVTPTPETRRARSLRAIRNRDRLRVRDDFERQLARSENRPACRRVADATANRSDRGRRRGRVGNSLCAQPANEGVWVRRGREHWCCRAKSAARSTGDADLEPRAGSDWRQPRLEDDRHRRGRWCRAHSVGHDAGRDEKAAHSAARRRHWNLSSDVGDFCCGRRSGDRSLVR